MIKLEFNGETKTNSLEMHGAPEVLVSEMMAAFFMMYDALSGNPTIEKLKPMIAEQAMKVISGEVRRKLDAAENQN